MDENSQIQLRWSRERFGLLMVNSHRQKFFMHAEKFLELLARSEYFVEVKLRDQKPNRAVGYYPGQVIGTVNQASGGCNSIVLHVSSPFKDIAYDEKAEEFVNILTTMKFTFPVPELALFKGVVEIMVRDRFQFDERLRAAEATPLDTKKLKGILLVPPE